MNYKYNPCKIEGKISLTKYVNGDSFKESVSKNILFPKDLHVAHIYPLILQLNVSYGEVAGVSQSGSALLVHVDFTFKSRQVSRSSPCDLDNVSRLKVRVCAYERVKCCLTGESNCGSNDHRVCFRFLVYCYCIRPNYTKRIAQDDDMVGR